MPKFEEWLPILAPPWLQDDGGKAMLGSIGGMLDRGVDVAKQSTKARFPEYAPPDGLPLLAAERQLPQAPWETAAAWATYVRGAYEVWGGSEALGGGAGTPLGILVAVSRSGVPFTYATDPAGSPDATTYVQWNGRWVQLYADQRTPIFGWLDGCATRPNSSWLPTALGSTLKLWLRADLGVTQSSGRVSAWADQSGNGNGCSSGVSKPLLVTAGGGQKALVFDPGQVMSSTTNVVASSNPRTVFIVTRHQGGLYPFSFRTTSPGFYCAWSTADVDADGINDGALVYADGATKQKYVRGIDPGTLASAVIYEMTWDGNTANNPKLSLSGVPLNVLNVSGSGMTSDAGGAGYLVTGDENSEIIVCDTVLSAIDASSVRNYLSRRYGIGALPAPPVSVLSPGWYDGNPTFASKSYLLFPSPNGVVSGLDNSAGNALKAKLNATVKLWKAAAETYGGAWVFDSVNHDIEDAPPGSEEHEMAQGIPGPGVLGWPPRSIDSFRVGWDCIASGPSTKIDPT